MPHDVARVGLVRGKRLHLAESVALCVHSSARRCHLHPTYTHDDAARRPKLVNKTVTSAADSARAESK